MSNTDESPARGGMLSPTDRGRGVDLCLTALLLAITACGAGAPAAPLRMPGPAVAAADSAPILQPKPKKPKSNPKSRPKPKARTAPAATTTQGRKQVVPTRPAAVDSTLLEQRVTRKHAHWPLAVALARRSGNPGMAEPAAAALVYQAERLSLSPSLLGAVLLIENTPLDPTAVSSQGAIGLMQVMPVHRGSYGCLPDLVNVESNICHGARILKHLVRRTKSLPLGLKRYNGCVRGRNTPRCYRYPARVLRTASRLRREILLIAADSSSGYQEVLAAVPQRRSGSGRPQLVMSPDSIGTEIPAPIQCASFLGCLRYRWTSKY